MGIEKLPGLGPKSADQLRAVGIMNEETLLKSDPYVIYRALKANNPNTSLNFLYAIMGAQQGVHWQVVAKERRTEILMRLDEMGLAPK